MTRHDAAGDLTGKMLKQGILARDGWEFHRRPDALPIQRIQVCGERSSGTNFMRVILERHVAAHQTAEYGWKHGFISCETVRREDLLVVVFREASAWLLSLYRKPWHVPVPQRNVSFAGFLRQVFETRRDMDLGPREAKGPGARMMPIQLDRDPLTGLPFANPILLRNAKNRSFLSLRNRECNACLVRHEAVLADPGRFMAELAAFYDIEHDVSELDLPTKNLGRFGRAVEGDNRDAKPAFSAKDREFLHEMLDAGLETELGYTMR